VKKTTKSQILVVPDGVTTLYMTASRVTKDVEVENTRDGPEYFQA
jgi:hypothetical protein